MSCCSVSVTIPDLLTVKREILLCSKMSKRTNLDIKDAACLHIVHNLQHPTSRPTTKSTQTTMVNAPKMNISPLLADRYGKSTMRSTQRCHHANDGKSGLEAERVRALGALCSLGSKKKLAAEKRWETHFLSNEEKEEWIQDYVARETAGARKRVEDAQAAVQQVKDDMTHAEIAWLTSREPEKTFEEMLDAIGDSLSDLASSDNGEDGEYENDEQTEQGKLSEDDEPGWVMGTITKTVQQRMERFRQRQMKLDELTQPGWEDAADYFCQRDKKYGTFELRVPAVVQPQTYDDALAPPPTTVGELMESLDIVPGISQRQQWTSRPGSIDIRLGLGNPQSKSSITSGGLAAEHDSSTLLKADPVEPGCSVEPVICYPCIEPPAIYHMDIGFRRRDGDGSCVCGRIDMQTVDFDVRLLWTASCLPISQRVSCFLISVTKLWDMIIRLCMCKGRTHHVKVLESKSHFKTAKTYGFFLQVTVKSQSKSNISDEMC